MRRSRNERTIVDRATDVMHRQVAQMVRLVEDLLDISRVGQDKLSIRRVPIDLASVVHHAVEASAPLLDSAGLSYTVALPDAPIYIEADAGAPGAGDRQHPEQRLEVHAARRFGGAVPRSRRR